MLLKITYPINSETHLLKLREETAIEHIYEYVEKVFKKLPPKYRLVYIDQDGDQICLENDHDLGEMKALGLGKIGIVVREKEIVDENEQKVVKMAKKEEKQKNVQIQERKEEQKMNIKPEQKIVEPEVQQKKINQKQVNEMKDNEPNPRDNFIHQNVKCDKCGVIPIIGNRYKCTICHDFDLCESCQAQMNGQKFQDNKDIKQQDKKEEQLSYFLKKLNAHSSDHILMKVRYHGQLQNNWRCRERMENRNGYGYIAIEAIGGAVLSGTNMIKKGINAAVTTLRKLSSHEKQEHKNIMQQEKKRKPSNIEAAFEKMNIQNKEQKNQKEKSKPVPKQPLTQEDIKIQKANYLSQILALDFSRCFAFVMKHPELKKQELLVQYFNNIKAI